MKHALALSAQPFLARLASCNASFQLYQGQCLSLAKCRTVCDPYLGLFRGIIPPLGGTLDLSPILAFVVLNVSAMG